MPGQFRFGVQQPREVGENYAVRLWHFRRAGVAGRLEDQSPITQFVDRLRPAWLRLLLLFPYLAPRPQTQCDWLYRVAPKPVQKR